MKKNLSLEKIKEERRRSRTDKVSSLIKKTIAEILLTHDFNDIDGQNILLFVSNVTLSADAKNATIFLEAIDKKIKINKELIEETLFKSLAKIKREFSSKIELRYTPRLRFEILR